MRLVVDASVAVKWFFQAESEETEVPRALELLRAVMDRRVRLLQPPHFVAEVAAVLSREASGSALNNVRDLLLIDMEIVAETAIYEQAVALSARYGQHLFDTLYHATALSREGVSLVTADDRYAARVKGSGGVIRLGQLALSA